MRFKCVREGIGAHVGQFYFGSIVSIGTTHISNFSEINGSLRVVIFNDNRSWLSYHPSHFEPA